MLVRTLVVATAMSAVATLAHGQDATGNDLQGYCTDARPGADGFCFGYIIGAIDGLISGVRHTGTGATPADVLGICIPNGVTKGQIRDVVLAFLTDHPEKRHEVAPVLVRGALAAAFPC